MKCAGTTTGMSSCSTPSGKLSECSSQNDRRQSLFHAVRSAISGWYFVTWVFICVSANARARKCDCFVLNRVSRWTLPVAKSEPVFSSAPSSNS